MNTKKLKGQKKPKKVRVLLCKPRSRASQGPRATKSTRITTKNEHRRSWRAKKTKKNTSFIVKISFKSIPGSQSNEKYEKYFEEPETTNTHRQNSSAPTAATPKLRKFTYKMNMQARKYVNSDEFRPAPRSSTRPFTITVRTPSVNSP